MDLFLLVACTAEAMVDTMLVLYVSGNVISDSASFATGCCWCMPASDSAGIPVWSVLHFLAVQRVSSFVLDLKSSCFTAVYSLIAVGCISF